MRPVQLSTVHETETVEDEGQDRTTEISDGANASPTEDLSPCKTLTPLGLARWVTLLCYHLGLLIKSMV